ncbi:MAG: IS1595 family transposase [Bacteroidetes bacterium]|nr:IS1595 family transposase [Bacteroidota bacterium]
MQYTKNLKELIKHFSDEQKCIDFLVQQRWGGCPRCPYCNSDKWYRIENGKRFKCANKDCRKKYSVTVGTPMHASNIPLTTWIPAFYLITSRKKGISSCQLARDLSISQKSAWFVINRVRETLRQKESPLLKNTVEVDELYHGGRIKNMSNKERATLKENNFSVFANKSMIIGMIERGGNLKLEVAPDTNRGSIIPMVYRNVDKSASLMTDGEGTYINIGKNYVSHQSVNHSIDEYVRDGYIHTNTIEGAFGLFRRTIIGTYHKVSPKHLSRYCDEFQFRYNLRKMTDGQRFEFSLGSIEGKLSWKELTKDNGLLAETIIQPTIPKAIRLIHPEKRKGTRGKRTPVCQILNGEVIGKYDSTIAASEATGIAKTSISKALRGETVNAGGFQWKYL